MHPLHISLQQAPFVAHKSLCPRSKLHDVNGSGRFKFVQERREREHDDFDDFLDAHFDPKNMVSPGPGEYEVNSFGQHKKLGIILGEHTLYNSIKQPVPGPGKYNVLTKPFMSRYKASPSVIFAPPRADRFSSSRKSFTPGPGEYDTEKGKGLLSNFNGSQIFSISKTKRSDIAAEKTKTPGPAAYDTLPLKKASKSVNRFKFVHGFPS